MFRHLPQVILQEIEIIYNCETIGAVLQRLPDLLKSLASTQETASYIRLLETNIKKSENKLNEMLIEVWKWINDKIEKLETSRFAKKNKVKQSIEKAKNALNTNTDLSPCIMVDRAFSNLEAAANSVLAFGRDPLFDGWAEIGVAGIVSRELIPHYYSVENIPSMPKKISVKSKQLDLQKNEQHVELSMRLIKFGPPIYISKFIFPSDLTHLKRSHDLKKWKEDRDSDPTTLLCFFKILSKYNTLESISIHSYLRPRTVLAAEELCMNGEIGFYLHQFASVNPENYPLTHSQLLRHINTFLKMVEISIIQQGTKHIEKKALLKTISSDKRKKDKGIAIEWMQGEWQKNQNISQELMVDRLMSAIRDKNIELTRMYERSTYRTWSRQADPLPLVKKIRRPKTSNVKNR